ncbi:SxtJ family membrane protein [Ferrovibrio sp.]|uniref:SxtJ family membrane protein n=1 Tax=Ferrovibrio sp. TaxID=1917215 RepID=UPI0035B3E945
MANHESMIREEKVKLGSDRSFGLVFAAVFGLIGAWQIWHQRQWGWYVLAAGLAFLATALFAPKLLSPLNHLWFRFGLLLHKVVNPIIMGLLFFGSILPIGLIMRAFGKRPLNLKYQPQAQSYWVRRDPPGPPPESFRNQF